MEEAGKPEARVEGHAVVVLAVVVVGGVTACAKARHTAVENIDEAVPE